MTGSLRIKNGNFQMRFYWKDPDGRIHQKEESTNLPERGNKRAAEKMLATRLAELEATLDAGAPIVSPFFLAEMETWMNNVLAHEIRANTLHQYQAVYRKHIATYAPFKKLRLSDLTAKILQDYFNRKISSGLSSETIRKHYANIHKFLDYAVRLEIIPHNPSDRVVLPKKNRKQRGNAFSIVELGKLLSLFKDDPIELAINLTAMYGLRRSEVCGLKWDAVDLQKGFITIQHTAIVDCGHVIYSDNTKTESSYRRLPIMQPIRELLETALHKRNVMRDLLGESYHTSDYVCCWDDGSPILPEYLTRHYRKKLSESDLPQIQLRNLRDSCATLLHQNGFDVKNIQNWLGHADPDTTARIYVHFQDANMTQMAESLEGVFKVS